MNNSFILTLKPDVTLLDQPPDQVVLQLAQSSLPFKQMTAGVRGALRLLSSAGATRQQLNDSVLRNGVITDLSKLQYVLRRLDDLKLLCYSVAGADSLLATLVPTTQHFQPDTDGIKPEQRYVLSRFAYWHRDGIAMLIESPRTHAQVILRHGHAAMVLAELAQPRSSRELGQAVGAIAEEVAAALLQLLKMAGLVCEVDADGHDSESLDLALTQWEFHDLLFHARSRQGRHTNPYGGTFPFVGRIEPLPVVKPKMSDTTIPLYRPDLDRLRESDAPFTSVLESRTSIRNYGATPITDRQLGEFLYRSARVKQMIPTDNDTLSSRPYPAGGAIYELELYAVVRECTNISAGIYHYAPYEHELCKIQEHTRYVDTLIELAWLTSARHDQPQVQLVITARFQRVAWKYRSMAYALVLKHVGVLYQTMYLVATAMDLAPCALGGGDSDLFAAATGLDYYAEAAVGEFLIGSRPG
jgi:SagB-type dehydrogenase family enzyme